MAYGMLCQIARQKIKLIEILKKIQIKTMLNY